jgi:chemotaxis protein methyltransferase CheR
MELSQQSCQELARLIHRLCGLVIGDDKAYLVRHRLEPVVRSCGLDSFDNFLERLRSRTGGHLHDAIIEAITTKETSFFRDHWLFDAILKHVLPERASELKRLPERRCIRIWSAGTATGQEAYSLAMLVREFIDASAEGLRDGQFAVLASDISAEAIKTAKAASYSKLDVDRGISEPRLGRHFRHRGSHWHLADAVRCLVQFRRLSLLDVPDDIGTFDVILCRNVLIYFDEPTRKRVCRDLHRLLHRGGWLALGSAESLYGIDNGFETVKHGRAVLYRKRNDSASLATARAPSPSASATS